MNTNRVVFIRIKEKHDSKVFEYFRHVFIFLRKIRNPVKLAGLIRTVKMFFPYFRSLVSVYKQPIELSLYVSDI